MTSNEANNAKTIPRWRDRIQGLKDVPTLFRMFWEASPLAVCSSVLLRIVVSLIPVALLAITRVIIDSIYRLSSHQVPLPSYFWWLVGTEFLLAILATMLTRFTDFSDTVLGDRYTRYVVTRIMEHSSKLDLTRFEDPPFLDKMERARVQGTDRVVMIQMMGRLIQEGITTVSLAVGIFIYSPLMLLVLLLCVLPAFVGETHFAFLGYSLNFQQTPARRQMEYLRILAGSKENAKELKLFQLGPFLVRRFQAFWDRCHIQTVALAKRKLLFGGLLTVLSTLGYYGAYAYVIFETVKGVLTLGQLTFLAGAIAAASTNIQGFFSTFSVIADQALFMTDLLDFFAVEPRIVTKPGALLAPRPMHSGIEFRNVWFTYPGYTSPVLRDVNFHLEPGERIALVGENGQGKTTIAKLLTRLYDPSQGTILLDGVDLREYSLEDWWNEIGVIFQDFMRYDMSVLDNIAMGNIREECHLAPIQEAAKKSRAEEVIRRLPHGYSQVLGCRFSGGVDLSGGEWQKIALARAHLRNAQVLILDEPTAALDARSEGEIFARFAELTKSKSTVLISHRFSAVRMVDRILVIEDGKIIEEGSHDQLINDGGRYSEMFELQAAGYR